MTGWMYAPESKDTLVNLLVSIDIGSETPFHAYYMTFSGHYQYNWDNAMSAKNKDAVKSLPDSEPVKAYIACNLELEYALEYLTQRLEAAGILVTGIICFVFDVIYIFALSNKWGAVQRLLDCYWPQSQKASSSSIFKFVSKSLFSPLNRPPQAFSCGGLRRL